MWFWIALIILLIVLPTFYFKDKLGLETQGPFTLWKTKKGLKFLKKLSKYKKFWNWFADLGILISFGFFGFYYLIKRDKKFKKHIINYIIFIAMFTLIALPALTANNAIPAIDAAILFIFGAGPFLLYLLVLQTLGIIQSYMSGVTPAPGVAPIIPGVDVPGSPIKVPLSALIGLVVLLMVHEISHGIVALVQKVKVRSLGILTAGIFPIGAFTEPDEDQLKKEERRKRMRVFSAGSMANFTTAIVFFLVFITMSATLAPMMKEMTENAEIDYMVVGTVLPDSPAFSANLNSGVKIYNVDALLNGDKTSPITLQTDSGEITVDRNKEGFIGLASDYQIVYKNISSFYWVLFFSFEIVYWTYLLNFLVGIFNFLPMFMLDGGYLFVDLAEYYMRLFGMNKKESAERAVKAFTYVSFFIIGMIVINALPYFF